jgi:hypothetical protein
MRSVVIPAGAKREPGMHNHDTGGNRSETCPEKSANMDSGLAAFAAIRNDDPRLKRRLLLAAFLAGKAHPSLALLR